MRYHDITKNDMKNGDGLRVVLWVSGCSHNCPGCQNPITWDPNKGLEFDEAAYQEISMQLQEDYISGLTLSGGDPLFPGNREAIKELLRRVKSEFPEKTVWLYTGYTWDEIRGLDLLTDVDVLVDGEYKEAVRDTSLPWRGSSNQRVIDVQATLGSDTPDKPVIWCY